MTDDGSYVLDANVFIEARRYYAFDLAPRFWESLIAANGRVCSIDRVKQELERGKDELAESFNNDFTNTLASTDQADVIQSFSEIMTWVQAQNQFSLGASACLELDLLVRARHNLSEQYSDRRSAPCAVMAFRTRAGIGSRCRGVVL